MTNYAAMGYALLAADEMRLSEEQKERLWQLMYSNFDIVEYSATSEPLNPL